MKKLLPLAIAFGLMMPLAHAQNKPETPREKPAAAETTKPEKKTKETAPKKKEAKAGELSAADKELMAEAKKVAAELTPTQNAKVLELLNKGDGKALEAVEGIGEVKAKSIMAKRPFAKVEDVAMVDGIGIETYKNILATARPSVKTEKPKAEEKKKEEKTKEKTTKPETKPATKEKEKETPKKPA